MQLTRQLYAICYAQPLSCGQTFLPSRVEFGNVQPVGSGIPYSSTSTRSASSGQSRRRCGQLRSAPVFTLHAGVAAIVVNIKLELHAQHFQEHPLSMVSGLPTSEMQF